MSQKVALFGIIYVETVLADINECSKELGDDDKQVIQIDDNHTYMIGKYGPVIKCGSGDNSTFLNVKKDIDIDKLKNNQYKLEDIVETKPTDKLSVNIKGIMYLLKGGNLVIILLGKG